MKDHLQQILKKILFISLALGKVLPPVFPSKRLRVPVTIGFIFFKLLILASVLVSDVFWFLNIGEEEFFFHLNDFVTDVITCIVMMSALGYIFLTKVDESTKQQDEGQSYGCELLISK